MLKWLTQHFTDPDEERKAKNAYNQLEQGTTPFHKFWSEFVELALNTCIPWGLYKEDLWRKLNPTVRNKVSAIYYKVCCNRPGIAWKHLEAIAYLSGRVTYMPGLLIIYVRRRFVRNIEACRTLGRPMNTGYFPLNKGISTEKPQI